MEKDMNKSDDILSISRQLGQYVGRFIAYNRMPTLSTDAIQGAEEHVVQVNEEDTDEFNRLDSALNGRYPLVNERRRFGVLLQFQNMLAMKYLDEIHNAYIPSLDTTQLDKLEFLVGINEALWDCDFSHYIVYEDDFIGHTKFSSYIKLTLHITDNPYLK